MLDPFGGRAHSFRVDAMLFSRCVLSGLGERLGDDEEQEEKEEDVTAECDVEHADNFPCLLHDVTCKQGTDGKACEETSVEVAKHNVALVRNRTVRGVGV